MKAKWKGQLVAVKKFDGNCPRQQKADFDKEIEILSQVDHKNVLKLFGYNIERNNTYLVTELMQGGSLFDYIKSTNNRENGTIKINWPKDFDLIKQIIDGMAYLHDKRILHLDLKTLNVLLDESKTLAKINDFGLSRISNMTGSMSKYHSASKSAKGTLRYMAPEVSKGQIGNFKSDVWSFGCILLEICTREIPFHALPDPALFPMLQNANAEIPINLNKITPRVISVLVYKCLNRDHNKRPTFAEIKESVKNVNNEAFKETLATMELSVSSSNRGSQSADVTTTTNLKSLIENTAIKGLEKQIEELKIQASKPPQIIMQAPPQPTYQPAACQQPCYSSYSCAPIFDPANIPRSQFMNSFASAPQRSFGVPTGQFHVSSGSANGRAIMQGPRGGLFYNNSSGGRTYL